MTQENGMKITLAMVESVDGKTTHGTDRKIFRWTSPEDQAHFHELIEKASLIVMGSKTYEAAKKIMKHQVGKLRVIFTRDPSKYAADVIPGQLEFTNETPQALVARLAKLGYTQMLLASGAQVNGLFFDAGLVDELILTLEPKLLGQGNPLSQQNNITRLKLLTSKQLNEQGTLLLHYAVEK